MNRAMEPIMSGARQTTAHPLIEDWKIIGASYGKVCRVCRVRGTNPNANPNSYLDIDSALKLPRGTDSGLPGCRKLEERWGRVPPRAFARKISKLKTKSPRPGFRSQALTTQRCAGLSNA
jgi:hypothetical protein